MSENHLQLSIVVPVFNEAANLEVLYSALTEVLVQTKLSYELIFVDDGSSDKTFEVIRELNLSLIHI